MEYILHQQNFKFNRLKLQKREGKGGGAFYEHKTGLNGWRVQIAFVRSHNMLPKGKDYY